MKTPESQPASQELEAWRVVHEGSQQLAHLLGVLIRFSASQPAQVARADILLQGLLLLPRGRPPALLALQALVLYANGRVYEAADMARAQEYPLFKVVLLLCALKQGGPWQALMQELRQSDDADMRNVANSLADCLGPRLDIRQQP